METNRESPRLKTISSGRGFVGVRKVNGSKIRDKKEGSLDVSEDINCK